MSRYFMGALSELAERLGSIFSVPTGDRPLHPARSFCSPLNASGSLCSCQRYPCIYPVSRLVGSRSLRRYLSVVDLLLIPSLMGSNVGAKLTSQGIRT